jgi:2-polyprenyl-6-hydroxyphenyl methylase / 3-demethylubiquinone-9 3-methyltransferase
MAVRPGVYEEQARTWWAEGSKMTALRSFNPPRFEFFDRYVPTWDGVRVLDVGCGGGFTAEFLASRGASMVGIDPSAALIDTAREHARQSGLEIDYDSGVAEQLPYDDASFGVVTCVDVLEHVDDVGRVIKEIHRVLKPGGVFCFDTINRTWRSRIVMIWLAERVLRAIPVGAHDWRKFITLDEVRAYLSQAGFGQVDLDGLSVRGQNRDGSLRIQISKDMSVQYIGCAHRSE